MGYNSQTGIITSSYWDIGTSGQNTSGGTGIGITSVGTNTITDNGNDMYLATDGSNATVDIFVDWNFGTDNGNPWVYLGDGQWPILYWQQETQP